MSSDTKTTRDFGAIQNLLDSFGGASGGLSGVSCGPKKWSLDHGRGIFEAPPLDHSCKMFEPLSFAPQSRNFWNTFLWTTVAEYLATTIAEYLEVPCSCLGVCGAIWFTLGGFLVASWGSLRLPQALWANWLALGCFWELPRGCLGIHGAIWLVLWRLLGAAWRFLAAASAFVELSGSLLEASWWLLEGSLGASLSFVANWLAVGSSLGVLALGSMELSGSLLGASWELLGGSLQLPRHLWSYLAHSWGLLGGFLGILQASSGFAGQLARSWALLRAPQGQPFFGTAVIAGTSM